MGIFKKLFGKNMDEFCAPMAGKAVAISEVPDPTFAEGMLGNGIAIEPSEGKVYAPCDATVDMMFATGHAVSLVADCGAEILIHVGLETVGLEGKPFTVHAKDGDKVKKGQLLIEADLDSIMAAGLPDGNYHLGVNDVVVIDGDAKLASNGTRAGSTLTQDVALKNMLKWLPNTLEEIIPTLTENPARAMNLWDRKGSIADGKDADLVLLDEQANVVHVFARGKQVR